MIDPIEKEIELPNGSTKTFILSKFPAVVGREIISQYPTSAAPKVGNYSLNEELMFKLLAHIGVPVKGKDPIMLKTRALVDNHIPDWETLVKVEWAMMEYNCSFFTNGRVLGILDTILPKVNGLISSILIQFVQQLSAKDSPPSTN
jgi:hypothetical protein